MFGASRSSIVQAGRKPARVLMNVISWTATFWANRFPPDRKHDRVHLVLQRKPTSRDVRRTHTHTYTSKHTQHIRSSWILPAVRRFRLLYPSLYFSLLVFSCHPSPPLHSSIPPPFFALPFGACASRASAPAWNKARGLTSVAQCP